MKQIKRVTDRAKIEQASFADAAGVKRAAESGLDLRPIGALNTAKRTGPGCPVYVFNNSGSVAFVKFGTESVTAPAGFTDGIPIKPNDGFFVNSGDSEWIIGSAATLYGYVGDSSEE